MSNVFQDPQRFPSGCHGQLQDRDQRGSCCAAEQAKCCQKNLEWKLAKATRLICNQKEAEKASKRADDAFAAIKALPKWIGDEFAKLEKLKEQIAQGQ